MITTETITTLADTGHLNPEALARISWSLICEPTDATAGALIDELGALLALDFVLTAKDGDKNPELNLLSQRVQSRAHEANLHRVVTELARSNDTVLIPSDAGWPKQLDDLGTSTPYVLYIKGNPTLLTGDSPKITITGARAATGYGEHVTMEITAGLTQTGHTVFSGAAYGIDGMAHRAALAGGGNTVAVLAGGLDRYYPSGHAALLARIAETGAVVTEMPPGAAPTKWRFLARNRILAVLSDATLIVEAGHRSGSLNTAGHAGALGRPLGAVPGPVTSPASAGCHRLIREYGATIITNTVEAGQLVDR